jgi:hypothetical protein
MPFDLPLCCRCGHVRGVANQVAPSSGFRLICYCKDCQAFSRFLERPDVLDAAGGTDIFQMPPGCVKLTAGADAVRSLRFSNKVFRWYADCCRTPLANTAADARFPLLGVIHSFISDEADGRSRDEALGPPLCRIHEGFGHRAAAGGRATARHAWSLRAARSEGARLVVARARLGKSVLRRGYARTALRAARIYAGRARRYLSAANRTLTSRAA